MAEPDTSQAKVAEWAAEFNVTESQIREAIIAVGTRPSDIELHLKGARSSSNADKVHDAGEAKKP